MYNRVILAEKPDMGLNIATALGISAKKRGHILLKNGDVVTWGIGHLIQLKAPNAYEKYKSWTWETLPVIPEKMETEISPNKVDQFKIVRELLHNSKECILATDPDREGEYIGRLILSQAEYQKKWKRLWIDDLTESTIRNGMENLRSSDEFTLLGEAAQIRSYADYWLGFTASRYFSLLAQEATGGRANLSAGRVQTPTLRLVYDREIMMEEFTSQPFYQLQANIESPNGTFKAQWYSESEEGRINRFERLEQVQVMKKKLEKQSGIIRSYQVKKVKRQAPQLFNSATLKTASRKQLGYSTVKTTTVLQALYDKGYVTYPRADSRHLSENKADQLAEHLNILQQDSQYSKLFPDTIKSLTGKSNYVDNKKAASHHAIVPTSKNPDHYKQDEKNQLSQDEQNLYALILRHTLAAHYPEGLDQEIEVVTVIAGETFLSRTVQVIESGWRTLLKPEKDDELPDLGSESGRIPVLQENQAVIASTISISEGKTSKPKRLNDDELETLMKYAGNFVDESVDESVLEKIKDKGIGTPATRTNIVQSLVEREYIEITKNLVYLTHKGRSFMQMVYDHPIASIELTGQFEKKLSEVEHGVRPGALLINEFKELAFNVLNDKDTLLQRIRSLPQTEHAFENIEEVGSCPKCGKPVIEHQKIFSCSSRKEGCDFSIWKDFRGVTLKSKQATDLLNGKELLIKNIPGKEEKPAYSLYIKLKEGKIDTRFPTLQDQAIGNCPACGKPVIEGQKGFGCSGWREGCKFTVWKSFKKTELTVKTVKALLMGKQVLLSDIPGEKGSYNMYIYIKDGKVESKYPTPEDVSLGSCPRCQMPVVEYEKSYSCSGSQKGCSFRLSKEFLGVVIPAAQIKKLLKSGKTEKITGLRGGKQGTFDTALGYDQVNNRYSFVK